MSGYVFLKKVYDWKYCFCSPSVRQDFHEYRLCHSKWSTFITHLSHDNNNKLCYHGNTQNGFYISLL